MSYPPPPQQQPEWLSRPAPVKPDKTARNIILGLAAVSLLGCLAIFGAGAVFLPKVYDAQVATPESMSPGFKRTPAELRARLGVLTAESLRYRCEQTGPDEKTLTSDAKKSQRLLNEALLTFDHEESSGNESVLASTPLDEMSDDQFYEVDLSANTALAMAWVLNFVETKDLVTKIENIDDPENEWVKLGSSKGAESVANPPVRDKSEILKQARRSNFLFWACTAFSKVVSKKESAEATRLLDRALKDKRAAGLDLPASHEKLLVFDTPIAELDADDALQAAWQHYAIARPCWYALGWGEKWADCDVFYSYFPPDESTVRFLHSD